MKKESSVYDFSRVFEPALLDEMTTKGMKMDVKQGDTLMNIGQSIKGVPLIMSGVFKVCSMNEEGQEMLLYYVNAGESCAMTITCCMAQHESAIKATAEEDGSFLAVPTFVIDDWLVKYPSWKNFIMKTVLSRFNEMLKMIDSIAFKKMDERLEMYLRQKSKVTGSALINLSHQQIADELATNRVVISRLLKKMEDEKMLLLYRNQIKLLQTSE
jgi:CRP/FNR family transcriptional regulator